MRKFIASVVVLSATVIASASAQTVLVGGQEMFPNRNIVENAVNSADHTTLVAAVQAAGLVETLQSAGPFTVFAPTNSAFAMLPAGTVETLVRPENKGMLTGILTYHVVPGRLGFRELALAIKKEKGTATFKTAAGGSLMFMMNGEHNIMVKDEQGNVGHISTYDVFQSNGVIHVVDRVLMPK